MRSIVHEYVHAPSLDNNMSKTYSITTLLYSSSVSVNWGDNPQNYSHVVLGSRTVVRFREHGGREREKEMEKGRISD